MKSKLIAVKLAVLLLCGWSSCADTSEDIRRTTVDVVIELPENAASDNLVLLDSALSITFSNISTNQHFIYTTPNRITLPEGLYDCFFEGWVRTPTRSDALKIKAYLPSIEVLGEKTSVRLKTFEAATTDDFVFEELFFTGVLTPQGKQYYGCSYFKIRNNSDKVLYADSLIICESKFTTTMNWNYKPDIRHEAMPVQAVYMIPGGGKDVPVKPGESLLIADIAIDHRQANPNGYDLSRADFEWYDNSTRPNVQDIDNPVVPNLDKIYCYTLTIWVPHNRGFRSYALARMKTDKENYLKNYLYNYTYVMNLPSGVFPKEGKGYRVPNAWITDVVNCSIESDHVWNPVAPSLDMGWTYVSKIDHDKTRYGKSVRRKTAYTTREGREVLADTNNSTNDFMHAVPASMMPTAQTTP